MLREWCRSSSLCRGGSRRYSCIALETRRRKRRGGGYIAVVVGCWVVVTVFVLSRGGQAATRDLDCVDGGPLRDEVIQFERDRGGIPNWTGLAVGWGRRRGRFSGSLSVCISRLHDDRLWSIWDWLELQRSPPIFPWHYTKRCFLHMWMNQKWHNIIGISPAIYLFRDSLPFLMDINFQAYPYQPKFVCYFVCFLLRWIFSICVSRKLE
jgi:hypothetical protein